MNMINVAVIGYGFAGKHFHTYLVGLTPGLKLYGIAARDAEVRERAKQERGCRTYESFEEAIADPAVDLVVLATPHHLHGPQAIAAMEAGKHVVTDKVMCLSVAECDAMMEVSRRTGKLLTVFHNRRWDGDFLTLKKTIADGVLGPPDSVKWIEMAWQKFTAPAPQKWRGQRSSGGGRIFDLGAHLLDQLLVIFPQPVKSVHCSMHTDWPESDVESHAMITVELEGAATAICDVGCMTRSPKARFYAVGPAGTFVKNNIDPQEAAMIAGDIDAAREEEAHYAHITHANGERVMPTIPGRWRSFYENVADVLLHGAEPAVKLPEMRRLLSVIEAAFESARTGQVVRLSSSGS